MVKEAVEAVAGVEAVEAEAEAVGNPMMDGSGTTMKNPLRQ